MAWQLSKRDVADGESPKVLKIDIRTWKTLMVLLYHERSLSKLVKRLGDCGRV